MSLHWLSRIAVEKSLLAFRIWESAVRSITSIISMAMDSSRFPTTDRVTGSTSTWWRACDAPSTSMCRIPFESRLAEQPSPTTTVL